MADHYLEFSQVVAHLTEEEFEWLGQQLEVVHAYGGREHGQSEMTPEVGHDQTEWTGYRFLLGYNCDLAEPEAPGFCFELNNQEDSDWGRHLWVYVEEYGDLGPLAHLVQTFLQRFRPTESWGLTYASTCSKPRVDAFGGGAMFVTAQEIKFDSAWDFIAREAAAFAHWRALHAAANVV